MDALPTISTARTVLRAASERDLPALLGILAEPAVSRWWGVYDDARARHEFLNAEYALTWIVERDGAVIGCVQASEETEADYRYAELDIFLRTASQGIGIGPEVLRGLMVHFAADRDHHRFQIAPDVRNANAIAAYERAGFRPVGVLRDYERGSDGDWHDNLLLDALTRELPAT